LFDLYQPRRTPALRSSSLWSKNKSGMFLAALVATIVTSIPAEPHTQIQFAVTMLQHIGTAGPFTGTQSSSRQSSAVWRSVSYGGQCKLWIPVLQSWRDPSRNRVWWRLPCYSLCKSIASAQVNFTTKHRLAFLGLRHKQSQSWKSIPDGLVGCMLWISRWVSW
jgi:hypothetical protein